METSHLPIFQFNDFRPYLRVVPTINAKCVALAHGLISLIESFMASPSRRFVLPKHG